MTLSLTATQPTAPNSGRADYRPGACNIGKQEIDRRRRLGHVGAVATAGFFLVLVALGVPDWWRFAVALPAAGTAVSYLEAALKFCVAFGTRGVFNFGPLGSLAAVADPSARSRDRLRALEITLVGLLIGLAVGAIAVVLPV